ncbi:MAG: EAL domain-containing protein [Deltaproteobacteria bacterium]|jgi:diguanylate cyclase (GGDEF)-like protein/PAS domain S-box-containing protein|nr:EAL domain-containing protein [Deltaproteobacteria bacterium]
MTKKKLNISLDQFGLIIIGTGASAFYYYLEESMAQDQSLGSFITIAIILLISMFTQLLINNINRSSEALRESNETLEQKVIERTKELRESEVLYRTIFENTGAATVIIEDDMTISLANSVFVNMSGFGKGEIEQKKSFFDFLDEKSHRNVLNDVGFLSNEQNLECKFINKEREEKDIFLTITTIPGTENNVASLTDISELKEAERQISHQAFHDTLTNLPNRALFMEHLNMAIKRGKRRTDYHFAVLYLDIDRFKLVNDSLGHSAGDNLLNAFSERIQNSLRDIDTLARLGGDEFVILLEDIESEDYASVVAERLQQALRRPFMVSGKEVFAPASFGVVLNTKDYDLPEDIIRDADAAMYHAKEKGRAQFKVFDKKLHEKALHLLQRETDLRKAIHRKEFVTHYQPIVSLESRSVVGFEALIRWRHPQLGLIYPGSFISIAEETGLIIPITRLVMQEACSDLKSWQDQVQHLQKLTMNVNISSKHFLLPSLLADIKEVLDSIGLPPDHLKLEITETALMEDVEETVRHVNRMRDYGLQIVIDDFGTGYSSLSYLQRLPIDTLKVDRSFVSRIQNTPDGNRNIVEAIISLAHRLDMIVVAEGVENLEQYTILLDMKCQFGQGYLFSKPMAKDDVDKLINNMLAYSRENPGLSYPLTGDLLN